MARGVSSFERLFNPRGVAVVGASAEPARPGGQTIAALQQHGFKGGVYPVNPKYPEIAGYRCYASIAEIGGECDVAVIALPAAQVPGVIRACGDRGIAFAVVLAGGFREAGADGQKIEEAMLAAAREGSVRIIGPNCLGLVNLHARVYAAWGSLTRPPLLSAGPVSAVLQSASLGTTLLVRCATAGVGFRHVVTSGNEADITAPELIDGYVDDPDTRVILAYLEGVSDGRAFLRAARRALAARKPLVVLKAGNTEQGRRAAASHTANLTGDYDVYRAVFRQCGVIEVHDLDEAADVTLSLVGGRLPRGRRVAVMGGSGGAAAMFADRADELRLSMPPLAEQTLKVLRSCLPSLSSLQNPIDYTAGYPRPGPGLDFRQAFDAVLNDPGIDQLAVMFAAAGRNQLQVGGELLGKVAFSSDKPIVVFSGMTQEIAPEGLGLMREAGIPVVPSPKRAAVVMAKLADYAAALGGREQGSEPHGARTVRPPALPAGAATLDEHESKKIIAAAGVPVTRDRLVPVSATKGVLADIAYPVAVKIVSPDIAHKTDIGAVRLNVRDRAALEAALSEIVNNARRAAPEARISGVLISEMITDGLETIIGVVNDAVFGPVVAFGLGGIFVETLRDVSYRVAPFGLEDARAMTEELRARPVFDGVRGGPPRDLDALVATLARVSELAWHLRDRLAEMDINPLLVRPRGQGVVAADAMIVLR
ncbi:MAG: acetate--CoA ligase family protein [Betaproteobacteria bacterium]|nr:acetate--CoA ligase family protein [Betaproteobacteria bacterium]MDH3437430.1 acetate--CoA ligase family protein [Betaproteobacteria bacterium]